MLRVLVLVAWLVVSAARAHADTVALLPLDGEKRLEIYGQPVAAEIGRALEAQGYDVVVVGAKMDVPDRAQLIVDGTIKADKSNAITLTLRIRDPRDGTTLETLPASAATLTTIDKAAAELSAKLIPAVKSHLDVLAKAAQPHPATPTGPTNPERPITRLPPPVPSLPPVVVSISAAQPVGPGLVLLANGLSQELPAWAAHRKREPKSVQPQQMTRTTAVKTTLEANASVGVAFETLGFSIEPGAVPFAHGRVRVRIVHAGALIFERVVRTDTVVGDRGISDSDLAARTAREVLAITNAQLRRLVGGWR